MNLKQKLLKQIGQNILSIRIEKRIERKQAAFAIGITEQAYGQIENGKIDLNATRILQICEYFNEEPNTILKIKGGGILTNLFFTPSCYDPKVEVVKYDYRSAN
jgi:DNA-binding XRE family transcriptional regulator